MKIVVAVAELDFDFPKATNFRKEIRGYLVAGVDWCPNFRGSLEHYESCQEPLESIILHVVKNCFKKGIKYSLLSQHSPSKQKE